MPSPNNTEVAHAVARTLEQLRGEFPEVTLLVRAEEVVRTEDGWNVPVHPDHDLPRATPYYDFLGRVEDSVRQEHHLDVFIVPSGVLPKAG